MISVIGRRSSLQSQCTNCLIANLSIYRLAISVFLIDRTLNINIYEPLRVYSNERKISRLLNIPLASFLVWGRNADDRKWSYLSGLLENTTSRICHLGLHLINQRFDFTVRQKYKIYRSSHTRSRCNIDDRGDIYYLVVNNHSNELHWRDRLQLWGQAAFYRHSIIT